MLDPDTNNVDDVSAVNTLADPLTYSISPGTGGAIPIPILLPLWCIEEVVMVVELFHNTTLFCDPPDN